MKETFQQLCSPISIGYMWLKNRMVMAPMSTAFCDDNQMPNDRLLRYYEERAKGGVSLITTELTPIDETHRYAHRTMTLGSDKHIDAHRRFTEVIHQHGCKIQSQLSHPGPESASPLLANVQPVGPSVTIAPIWGWNCRQLPLDELPLIAQNYGEAARRAREAGYDGIELHAAHCDSLLGSFLSPLRNKRTDDYSGFKLQTRMRFVKEVLQEIKSRAGSDFPITLNLSGYERFPGGGSIDDTQKMAPELVAAGVDCFRISGGISDSLATMVVNSSDDGDGINASFAEAIKHVVDVPVMVVGRIHDPMVGERIIARGQADLVMLGRPLLADPKFAQKVITGNVKAIRRCISCQHCVDTVQKHDDLSCAINPIVGREFELPFKSSRSKNVWVIGSGVAGLEAARLAASAGHAVTLFERQRRLGGSLKLASVLHKDNERYLGWLLSQVKRLPINIKTGVDINVHDVVSGRPDVVIVATGASIVTPDIQGVDQPHVITGQLLHQIAAGAIDNKQGRRLSKWKKALINRWSVRLQSYANTDFFRHFTRIWLPIGSRVVIVGSDFAGVGLAEFLAERNRRVHLLESEQKIISEVGDRRRSEHMARLDKLNITVNTAVNITRIKKNGVVINAAGCERTIAFDSIIVVGQTKTNNMLAERIKRAGFTVHAIGDCNGSGLIAKATQAAADVVSQL